ncbi:MAG: flagellar biosynthetic protein FliR [Mangrovicoccus sp.]
MIYSGLECFFDFYIFFAATGFFVSSPFRIFGRSLNYFALVICSTLSIIFFGGEGCKPPEDFLDFILPFFIGIVSGFSLNLYFWFLSFVASIAAQSLSLSQILGASQEAPEAAVSKFLTLSGLVLLVTNGIILKEFASIHSMRDISLDLNAIRGVFPFFSMDHFSWGFMLAFPFLSFSCIYYFSVGFINRGLPQFMVAFVGAPFVSLSAIFLLFLTAPYIVEFWLEGVPSLVGNRYEPK